MLQSCIVECWIGIVGCVSEWLVVNDKICLWSDLLYSVVEKELKDTVYMHLPIPTGIKIYILFIPWVLKYFIFILYYRLSHKEQFVISGTI